ncbi:TolB family protein [Amycolatopsis sp. cmx-4-54]|uniref:TolB family protein n=1 Tax=Amycolatopsis sp. cmx-4-54 TaxID=2790936 RepID=UPI00397DD828
MKRTWVGVAAVVLTVAAGAVFVGLRTGDAAAEQQLDLARGGLLYVDESGRVRQDDRVGPSCQRVDVAAGTMACLRATAVPDQAELLVTKPGAEPRLISEWGLPSRVRVSPSGRLVGWTVFRSGDSYLGGAGTFSTTAGIFDLATGNHHGSLEDFALTVDGKPYPAADLNYWGVTFARDDLTFYATARSAGGTWLIRGDLRTRTLTSLRRDVECPSLSPDGTRVAYKFRDGARWRLHVLRLADGLDVPLADPAHLDDQPQWLDDRTVAYGRDKAIYAVPADGTGTPALLRSGASSPAVVR